MNRGGFARDPRAENNPNKNAAPKKLGKRDTGKILRRLGKYLAAHWVLFTVAIVFTLLSNQLSLLGPQFSGDAIDAIAAEGGVNYELVLYNVGLMLGCYAAAGVLSYVLAAIMIFLSQKIVYSMRKSLFDKLTTLPVGYFDQHATGDIISRISYDIDTVNASLSHDLVQVMTSVYTVVGSLIFMWQISKPMILVFAVTVPASIIFTRFRAKRVRPLFRARSAKLGELNGYAEEMLSGTKSIRAYGREDEIVSRFDKRNLDAVDAYYRAEYYGATLGPAVNFINNLSISLITILGGILYMFSQNGVAAAGGLFFITLGGVSKFVQYSRKFAGPINEFANILNEFQSAFAAADRVFKIIDEDPEPTDKEGSQEIRHVRGKVELDRVKFGYTPEKTIIHDLSLLAEEGKTVAIVGPTGAGKTTVINLLMRFYDVDDGKISVDGFDIRDLTRGSLRASYTMVLQETWLFYGTIYENIAYGSPDATREDVIRAAKAAHIHEFIESLPEGYDTVLSDDGVNISKGQKQLITIARAMLPKSPMLILDEATSNVDSRTEINIQKAMSDLMKERTCFVIAHRLSTVKNADTIIVMQKGRVTEMGSHDELLAAGGFYASLYNSQFE
ncbi:MAG: ABC transporter ATP-binding protein [Ruminococcaceae bacterium]|nr:ABC transporter ATP-binding protein [Oscillospiraceae bacterium]